MTRKKTSEIRRLRTRTACLPPSPFFRASVEQLAGTVRGTVLESERFESFVVLAEQRHTDAASAYRMIRVSMSGDVTVGPELPTMQGSPRPFLKEGSPLRVFCGSVSVMVLSDLMYGTMEKLGGEPFHGAGRRLRVDHRPPA